MSAEWWRGKALTQDQHAAINAKHYPGTRQLCVICDQPTGQCEEDSMQVPVTLPDGTEDVLSPLCEECYDERKTKE